MYYASLLATLAGGVCLEKNYELMFVIAPDLKDDQLSAVKNRILEELNELGAVIEKDEDWGKRDLAFEVKDFNQGYYFLLNFKAPPKLPHKLQERFRVNEKIIRYLLTEHEVKIKPPEPQEEVKPPEVTKEAAPPVEEPVKVEEPAAVETPAEKTE
jgi:small subunit ribosomal protein S6